MFARFDENQAMNLQDIKETKGYGRTHGQRENSIPPTNKVCGGYNYRAVAAYLKVVRRRKPSSAEGTRGGRAREGGLFPLSLGGFWGSPPRFF